jgi:hypothetical protein
MELAPNVVWRPLRGSQSLAISCRCNHILLAGTRASGKSEVQQMYYRQFVGQGYGAFWRGVIFDRKYKNLDDLIAKSHRYFPKFGDGARFLASKSDYCWRWPEGETLYYRHIDRDSDYWNFHGHEIPFLGWNELTKYATPTLYDAMMSCNRTSFLPDEHSPIDARTGMRRLLPEIPLVTFATTNPYGPGHTWVKKRFVDPAPPGRIVRKTVNVYNPRTGMREDVTKTQVYLFSSYKENRYLSPEYIAELESLTDSSKRRAWLWGDWNVVGGGALDDVWDPRLVIPRFKVPASWYVDRSFDWGSTEPFSIGWWAEANGEEAELPDGSRFCPPSGTLVRIAEWYGSDGTDTNKGIKLSAKAIANGIHEREEELLRGGWISGRVWPGPADNQIRNQNEMTSDTIAKKMEDAGVSWSTSDKSPGSRVNGLQLVRDRMENALSGEGPGLFFTENCRASISILPNLPRHPVRTDDVDSETEDHPYDELRYRVLAADSRLAEKLIVTFPT